jgi:hypothetical protein
MDARRQMALHFASSGYINNAAQLSLKRLGVAIKVTSLTHDTNYKLKAMNLLKLRVWYFMEILRGLRMSTTCVIVVSASAAISRERFAAGPTEPYSRAVDIVYLYSNFVKLY